MKLEATKRIIHNSMCVITMYNLLIRWTAIRQSISSQQDILNIIKTSETCALNIFITYSNKDVIWS
jgi:hypothetical protein